MDIDNDDMLESILINELEIIMNDIGDVGVRELQKNIQEIVYDSYVPSRYERLFYNGGFIGSWIKEKLKVGNRKFAYSIYSDPNLLVYEPSKYQHGNKNVNRSDIMARAIAEGTDYDFYTEGFGYRGWWTEPRDYWTPTLETINDEFLANEVAKNIKTKTGWSVV